MDIESVIDEKLEIRDKIMGMLGVDKDADNDRSIDGIVSDTPPPDFDSGFEML